MGHIKISDKPHSTIKKHKKIKGSIPLAAKDIIEKGAQFQKMGDAVSDIAKEKNKTPEGLVIEIFYSALDYRIFLDKNIPVQVNKQQSPVDKN